MRNLLSPSKNSSSGSSELRIRENSGDANSLRKLWSKSLSSAATVPRGSNAGSMRSMIAQLFLNKDHAPIMLNVQKYCHVFFALKSFRTFQIRALMLLLWGPAHYGCQAPVLRKNCARTFTQQNCMQRIAMSNCHTIRLFCLEFKGAKVAFMPAAGRSCYILSLGIWEILALAVGLCCRSQLLVVYFLKPEFLCSLRLVSHTGYYGSWRKRHNFVIYESL